MAQDSSIIETSVSLRGFFDGVVEEAVRARAQRPSDATRFYLATLLADYARPGTLNRAVLDVPLPLLLQGAMQAAGAERFDRLRRLGDDVLYLSGFFGDHLVRRGVEVSFVSLLGARCYDAAAALLRTPRSDSVGPDVFSELSDRFEVFVAILSDVAETLSARAARRPEDVVGLYSRWLETGSDCLADELARWGLVVPKGGSVCN
jgi:hypothetical protein